MNRRSLIKSSISAGVASLLPFLNLTAKPQIILTGQAIKGSNGFRKYKLGDLDITVLTDGIVSQSPVYPFVAPLAKAEDVKKLLEVNFRPTDHIELGLNIMVIKSKDKLFLLDTGTGIYAQANQGRLLTSLADAGFDSSAFTDIIISHGHTDHIGGLLNLQSNFTFPNATIHIAKIEYEFWLKATIENFKNSPVYKMQDFVKQTITDIQKVFRVVQPKLKFIDFKSGLYDTFQFDLAPGHTPGLTMTTITSGGEKLMFIADLIHSDALLFAHPEWGFIGDTDIQEAVKSRKKVLAHLADHKVKTFAYHLPYPGIGHVRRKDGAFEWVPDVYATV